MMKGKACPEKRLTVRQMANINFLYHLLKF